MRNFVSLALAAGLLATPIDAIHLHKRTDGPQRVVGFPIQRKPVADPAARDRLRRRAPIEVILDNDVGEYLL